MVRAICMWSVRLILCASQHFIWFHMKKALLYDGFGVYLLKRLRNASSFNFFFLFGFRSLSHSRSCSCFRVRFCSLFVYWFRCVVVFRTFFCLLIFYLHDRQHGYHDCMTAERQNNCIYTIYVCQCQPLCIFIYVCLFCVFQCSTNFSYARDGNMLMQKRYGKWCAGYWQVCASFQMTLKSLYLAFALALSLPLSLCLYDLSYGVGAHLCGSCVMPVVINILYFHRHCQCHCHCHFGCGVRVFAVWLKLTHNNFCLWKFYVRARAFNEYSDERDGRRMRVNEFLSSVFFFLFVFQLYAKHDASGPRFSIDTLKFKRSISRLKEFYSYV